jgi:hypothetical protein
MPDPLRILSSEIAQVDALLVAVENWRADYPDDFAAEMSHLTYQARRSELRDAVVRERKAAGLTSIFVAFDGPRIQQCTMAVDALSGLLRCTQNFISACGQAIAGTPTLKGAIPNSVLEKTILSAVGVRPGSFEVELVAPAHQADLFAAPLIDDCVDSLHALIQAGDDVERLDDLFRVLGGRAQLHYDALMQRLSKESADFRVHSWDASLQPREARLGAREAQSVSDTLARLKLHQQREETLRGTLIGLRQNKRDYEFIDMSTGNLRSGRVLEDVVNTAAQLYNQLVDACFLVEAVWIEGRDEVGEKWTLKGLTSAHAAQTPR